MSTFVDSCDSMPETDSAGYANYSSAQFDSTASGNNAFESEAPIYGELTLEENDELGGSDGPVLPPPSEMGVEEGVALREWRSLNAIRLEEKEKRETELLSQIIEKAEQYKVEFYRKREITCENYKVTNREKEKLFLANQGKFHAEADQNYWKAIAELIPNEVPTIEKKGKKDKEKRPGITVIQGPKPGKPTELSRMRQILIKLKHEGPPHLKHSPAPKPSPMSASEPAPEAVVVV